METGFDNIGDQKKKTSTSKIANAVFIGVLLGIAVYSAVRSGFGIVTLLPLTAAYFLVRNQLRAKRSETGKRGAEDFDI